MVIELSTYHISYLIFEFNLLPESLVSDPRTMACDQPVADERISTDVYYIAREKLPPR